MAELELSYHRIAVAAVLCPRYVADTDNYCGQITGVQPLERRTRLRVQLELVAGRER